MMLSFFNHENKLFQLIISVLFIIILEIVFIIIIKSIKRKGKKPKISIIESIIYSIILIVLVFQFLYLNKISFTSIIVVGVIIHFIFFLIDIKTSK